MNKEKEKEIDEFKDWTQTTCFTMIHFKDLFFYVYVFACMYVCYVCTCGGQRPEDVLVPLELKLQVIVSWHMLGNPSRILHKEPKAE